MQVSLLKWNENLRLQEVTVKMTQIIIAMMIGAALGFWACAILTAGKVADLESLGDELGEIILKQKKQIENAGLDIEV